MTTGSLSQAESLSHVFAKWHRFLTTLIALLAVEAGFALVIRIRVLSDAFSGRTIGLLEMLSSAGLLLFPLMLYAIVRVRTTQKELHLLVRSEQESLDAIRTLLDTTAEGIYAIDARGLCTMANRAAGELLGYRPEELIGQNMHQLIHHTRADGSPYPRDECPIYYAMVEGRTRTVEDEAFWRKDGSSFSVSYASAPNVNDGQVQGAVVSFRSIEERKRMERSIEAAEQQTRRFLENLPLGVFVVDEVGRPTYSNRLSVQLMGVHADPSVEEAELSSAYPVYRSGTDELYPTDELPVLRALGGEKVTVDDIEIRRPDGSVVSLEVSASPIRDDDGTIRYAAAAFSDIRARKEAAAEIEEQADMLDLVEDAVIALDPDGRITYWNKTAAAIYGWTKEEALGRIGHELLRTKFPKPREEIMTDVSHEGRWEGELVHRRKDASEVVVASRWVLRRDEAGRPLQILEVNNDITAQKRAEAERVRQQELLSAIFDTSPDIIAMITSRLELTYVNPAAREILGYSFEELFGEESLHWVHPDDIQTVADLLESAFGEAGTRQHRLRVKNSAQDWIWLDIRVRRMGADADSAVVMARDITEQVTLEQGLEEARQVAVEANQAKSEFLSRMSHELRTPLNAILGFAQLLEMEELTSEQLDSTHQIVSGGRRLLDLINEVLDIARVESGRLALSLEPVLICDLIDECVRLIRPIADERGIRVRSECVDHQQHVWADRPRLGQILLNLLSNAVKYNVPEGLVTVTCTSPEGTSIRVGVTDTGPGISPDKVPLLFTPFERLGAEGSGVEGTGLGLALSKSLVEAMGGEILVDTMHGKGTTFWIILRTADELKGDPSEEEADERRAEFPARRSARVLYIEDNLANLRLIERLLARRSEIEVIPAMTGTLGLDLAREHLPDLILLDLGLPDIRGDQVLVQLRKDPRTAHIPVIILSADATPGEIKRLLAAGVEDYLTKPIDVATFRRVFDQVLEKQEAVATKTSMTDEVGSSE